jgi:putative glutamine amidotransferase
LYASVPRANLNAVKKPVIGVTPLWDESMDSLWMLPGYMDAAALAGGLPLMLPLTRDEAALEQLAGMCDGFIFTGGQDVSPGLYGEGVLPFCGELCAERDAMETALFSCAVLKLNKPALGICRGMQLFNALLGGTLYQDINAQFSRGFPGHKQNPPYDRPIHKVSFEPGSPLNGLLGGGELSVNSCHHQGIAKLAPRLKLMARAEDGLAEAVCMEGRAFVWAVQWHPEMALAEKSSGKIFDAFVSACA